MRVRVFRWKAIGPLLLALAVIAVLVVIFAEPVAKETTEEAGTELLGTQVDVGKLDIDARETTVDLHRLEIADPFDRMRNLVEAAEIRVKLNPEALAEKKIVVERLAIGGVRFGTTRRSPSRPVSGDGFAPTTLRAVEQWAGQFDVPLLQLTPIDTIRQLVLDPTRLSTIAEAKGIVERTDSTRGALEAQFRTLAIEETIDSALALGDSLSRTDPRRLGLQGARQAVSDVRSTLRSLDSARARIENLQHRATAAVNGLGEGVRDLGDATRRDYAFARGLLALPTFDAPELGEALFGQVSLDRFKQALYWAELARKYMPPGLLPREAPGPKRLRMSGTTVRFPKERNWPPFLLEAGNVDFLIAGDERIRGAYKATVRGLTSAPAIYGRPAVFAASRAASGSAVGSIRAGGVINHLGRVPRDSVTAVAQGIALPDFRLPELPFRVDPRTGTSRLTFVMHGNEIFGRWSMASNRVAWSADTAGRRLNDLERIVWRVASGLTALDVSAEVRGTIAKPRLAVSTNLDEALAARIRAAVGEEVQRAERMARAKVDSLVRPQVELAQARVGELRREADGRIAAERQRLDRAQQQLEAELKRLAGPAGGLVDIPKIKL